MVTVITTLMLIVLGLATIGTINRIVRAKNTEDRMVGVVGLAFNLGMIAGVLYLAHV